MSFILSGKCNINWRPLTWIWDPSIRIAFPVAAWMSRRALCRMIWDRIWNAQKIHKTFYDGSPYKPNSLQNPSPLICNFPNASFYTFLPFRDVDDTYNLTCSDWTPTEKTIPSGSNAQTGLPWICIRPMQEGLRRSHKRTWKHNSSFLNAQH